MSIAQAALHSATHSHSAATGLHALQTFLRGSRRLFVISGAGISTESGIPDYRSPGRPPHKPIQHQAFMSSEQSRRRYWARSMTGFPFIAGAKPNAGHFALAAAERRGIVSTIVTQNVDELHQKAGSRSVVNLHGSIFEVKCTSCGEMTRRAEMQRRLLEMNPTLAQTVTDVDTQERVLRPDGDIQLNEQVFAHFKIPACLSCGGVLKPALVFFGDNVPPAVRAAADDALLKCDSVLVTGTSLAVYSAYRLVVKAAERNIPLAVLNDGDVRGEQHFAVRVRGRTGDVLSAAFGFGTDDAHSPADAEKQKIRNAYKSVNIE